jgi:hypothetical protein
MQILNTFFYAMFEPVSSTPDSRRRAKKTPEQQVKPHHSALPQQISYSTKSPG